MFSRSFWGHLLVTLGGVAVTALATPVQQALAHHPTVFAVLGGVWAALGAFINPKPAAQS